MKFTKPPKKEKNPSAHPHSSIPTKFRDEETYKRHKQAIRKEVTRGYKNRDSLRILMRETAAKRREWIKKNLPSVAEVKECFPCFSKFQFVSQRFEVQTTGNSVDVYSYK